MTEKHKEWICRVIGFVLGVAIVGLMFAFLVITCRVAQIHHWFR